VPCVEIWLGLGLTQIVGQIQVVTLGRGKTRDKVKTCRVQFVEDDGHTLSSFVLDAKDLDFVSKTEPPQFRSPIYDVAIVNDDDDSSVYDYGTIHSQPDSESEEELGRLY
jgi:hypothetical protein